MKFKTEKGTDSYNTIKKYFAELDIAKQQAIDLAKELGAVSIASGAWSEFSGFVFESTTPLPDWKYLVPKQDKRIQLPKALKKNQWIFDRMKAIPFPKRHELDKALGWKGVQILQMRWVDGFDVITLGKKFALIESHPGAKYTPIADFTEILESEYDRLHAVIEAERKTGKAEAGAA